MLLLYLTLLNEEEEKQVITQIYLEHRATMLRVARMVLRDEALAEDAVHDAMLELIELVRIKGRPDMEGIRGYMCLLTRHRALDILRKERRHSGPSPEEVHPEPQVQDQSEWERRELVQALAALPPKYAQILYLYARHDLTTGEIARVLGISHANAKKRLQRAVGALREKWRYQNDDR